DERHATRVGRHLGVAGAVERDDVFWNHRALRLRRNCGHEEKQDKNDRENSALVFHLRLDQTLLFRPGGPLPGLDRLRELFDRLRKRELKRLVEQIAIIVWVVDISDSEVLEAIIAESLSEIFEEVALGRIGESRLPARPRAIHQLRINELRQIRFAGALQELVPAEIRLLIAERDRQPLTEPGLLGHLQRLSDRRVLAEKGMRK